MTLKRKIITAVWALVIVAYLVLLLLPHPPKTVVVPGPEKVVTVTVDRPTLETRTVDRIVKQLIPDTTQVDALMKENRALQTNVQQLTAVVASLQTMGHGTVEPVRNVTDNTVDYRFHDWRLDFNTDLKTASYNLHQQFEVLQTVGRQQDGRSLSLVKVFEMGEHGELTPLDVKGVSVFADQTRPHWMTRLRIQGGVELPAKGGLVGLQWLQHGRTSAPEDIRWAIATPVVLLSPREVGVLPLSFNLGALPRQPFTNIWVSPYVGASVLTQRVSRIGLAITAGF